MSPGQRNRPASSPGGSKVIAATNLESTPGADIHPAMLAALSAPWFNVLSWQQAIEREARSGRLFTADDLRAAYDLPDVGNALGGLLMRAARAGLIIRMGYRPSRRPSRSGGVISIWTGGAR